MKKRYIGITDEPLCKEGSDQIDYFVKLNKYPLADVVVSSPLKRCRQTAKIIYNDDNTYLIDDLTECDFGEFEGKNYSELKDNPKYIDWINCRGNTASHGGESGDLFAKRSVKGFEKAVCYALERGADSLSIICHGGVIMHIMVFLTKDKNIYNWQCKNGCGYKFEYDFAGKIIREIGEI